MTRPKQCDKHIPLLITMLLLAATPALSHAEIINFDDRPTGPIPYPYHQLTFAQSPYDGIRDASTPGVRNGIVSGPNAFLLSNQETSIQTWNTTGTYPKTFTFRGAYFTAATNEGLVVTVTGSRWGRDVKSKTFVLSTASPTYVLFNWSGIDEVQIVGSGGTPVQDRSSAMIVMDDLNIDMDGPFAFTPVKPCRLVDTRNSPGPFGGPQLSGNAARDFLIPNNSDCGIPRTAAAYAMNVTIVPGGPIGFLTIWPSGQDRPNVSALNSDGRIKAGGVIVPAGTDGGVSVYVTDATHLILDITGYFSASPGLAFYPLTPCRVIDTRNGSGDLGGPSLTGGAPGRSIPVLLSSCGIPPSAKAYALNFTAVPQGALGYLTVWPTGQSQPLVSTLNAPTGAVTANGAIVPAGDAGNISVYATNNTDLIVDVSGYFAPAGIDGLSLYTMTPCRVLDTRDLSGTFSGNLDVGLNRNCIIPYTARAYSLTATVLPTSGLGYLTLWGNGQQLPLASTLNALDGAVTSNIAIVPSTNAEIHAYATNNTQLILDIASYFAP